MATIDDSFIVSEKKWLIGFQFHYPILITFGRETDFYRQANWKATKKIEQNAPFQIFFLNNDSAPSSFI